MDVLCPPCLPAEMWTLVFRQLSLSDRLRVRASCKYFRDLVDNALLRDWTVRLRRSSDDYEEDFWSSLRCWRVTCACLFSPYGWTRVAKELPGLTSLTLYSQKPTHMQDLRSFTNLQRVVIWLKDQGASVEDVFLSCPRRLTHLKACLGGHGYKWHYKYDLPAEIPPDSPMKNLRSLSLHCCFAPHPVNVLHVLLSSLPQLRHLSLLVVTDTCFDDSISDLPPLENCALTSLELVECLIHTFPVDLMKMKMPFLRSLAIFRYCEENIDGKVEDMDDEESEKLCAWLRDLPALTSLLVMRADIGGFVKSIPPSVTCLALMPLHVKTVEMTALSAQLPNLRCLHLYFNFVDSEIAQNSPESAMKLIPQLFPKLKVLRLDDEEFPEDVFLSLASLKELEVLESQDDEFLPAALVSKLRELTNNRLRIYQNIERPWLSCFCVYGMTTECSIQV